MVKGFEGLKAGELTLTVAETLLQGLIGSADNLHLLLDELEAELNAICGLVVKVCALTSAPEDEAEQLIDGAVAVLAGNHLRLRLCSAASGMSPGNPGTRPDVLVLRSLRPTKAAGLLYWRKQIVDVGVVRMVMAGLK